MPSDHVSNTDYHAWLKGVEAMEFRKLPQQVAVTAKYISPTNHRGARVAICVPRAREYQGKSRRRIISYDHRCDSALECAANFIFEASGCAPVAIATVTNPDFAETLLYSWHAGLMENQSEKIFEALFPKS
jgi:hypothetical protein